MLDLPIDTISGDIAKALENNVNKLVVSAPTGSGKSTKLPIILAEKLDGKILILQPRRVAARMLAKSVSSLFNLGDKVGWHVRFDKHYDENTKIVFLTEAILARMILNDSQLKGVSAVVFDEFHERNIYADISLALALRTQTKYRKDLSIVVCSASMDADSIADYLGDGVAKFECESRLFPIEIQYAPPKTQNENIWDIAVKEFERLSSQESDGSFLIFMPGAYEINKTLNRLLENPRAKGFEIFALHGEIPPAQQDKILSNNGKRKIIVATNIAETSLTIEGVKFVIDSGLAKVAKYDNLRGVNTLLCQRISLASATQRAGRAGRTSAGRVVKLWRKNDEMYFDKYTPSEISRLDLSQILLWLKAGNIDFESLKLFENPPENSLIKAYETLKNLSALGSDGHITRLGKDMSKFPIEPRYSRLLIEAAKRNCLPEVAIIASLSDVGRIKLPCEDAFIQAEIDALIGDVKSQPEEIAKLCLLAKENNFSEQFCRRMSIHSLNARKAFEIARELERLARKHITDNDNLEDKDCIAKSILSAFSDKLGVRLNKGTLACRFTENRRGEIRKEARNYAKDIFVALDMKEQNIAGGVSILASMIVPISKDFLLEIFPNDFSEVSETKLDTIHKRVVASKSIKFRDLILEESQSNNIDLDVSARILYDEIKSGRLKLKNYDESALYFIERVNFVAAVSPESGIEPIDENALEEIFLQMCASMTSYSELKNADVHSALRDWLSNEQIGLLNYLAPKSIQFPKRKKPTTISYDASAKRATISAFFKDFYDFNTNTINICDSKIKPTFEILAPNGRPVQTTQNLDEFWQTSWLQIKKELKARYPKHFK